MRIPNNLDAMKTNLPGIPAGLLEEVRAETPRQAQSLRKLAFRCAELISAGCTANCMQEFLAMTALYPEGDAPENVLESVRKSLQTEVLALFYKAATASGGVTTRMQLTMYAANAALAACHPDGCQAAQEAGFWAMTCFPVFNTKEVKNA